VNLSQALSAAQDAQEEVVAAQARLEAVIADRDALVLGMVEGGFTYAEAGTLLGLSTPRIGQIVKAQRAANVAKLRTTPAERLAAAREAFHLATVAQQARAERASLGYDTEERAFYRGADTPVTDDSEQRIGWQGFHIGQERERYAS
jgi:hypothetical protein